MGSEGGEFVWGGSGGDDRGGGLMGERIENIDNGDVSARRRSELRDGASDAARAARDDCGASRKAETVEDAHQPPPALSRDVGNGFGSRKRRSTFSVMRDTLLS